MKNKLFFTFALLAAGSGAWAFDHSEFTGLLQDYVKQGVVDYRGFGSDPRFDSYLDALGRTDPETLNSRDEKLAFWINAYNAYTIKIVADSHPVESIKDLREEKLFGKGVWDRKDFVVIGGEPMSLNEIEHEIIRVEFDEPGIHFALVCAAKSCPPLRSEAFVASRLREQLDDQGRVFLSDQKKNGFDIDRKRANLSKIFQWYGGDFGIGKTEVMRTIAPLLPAGVREAVEDDPGEWRVSYMKYDWSLNDAHLE